MPISASLSTGVTAMQSFARGVEVVGENIANANTTGFKSSSVTFAAVARGTIKDTQGSVTVTGVSTDLAVTGEGYFRVVKTDDGIQFATRAGDFHFDEAGFLVTSQGMRVQGLTGGSTTAAGVAVPPAVVGSIRFGVPPAGTQLLNFNFTKTGELTEFYSDGSKAVTNQILVQRYYNPTALQRYGTGSNLFKGFADAAPVGGVALTAAGNKPGSVGLGSIEANSLEVSNVDLTQEFATLIIAQRGLQAASRIVTVSDTMVDDTINIKR